MKQNKSDTVERIDYVQSPRGMSSRDYTGCYERHFFLPRCVEAIMLKMS